MLLVYGGIVLLFFLQPNTKQSFTSQKSFSIFSFLFLFAISALRAKDYGDLIYYERKYNSLPLTAYSELFDSWQNDELKDFGFYAFAKFFADLGVSAEIWMVIIGAIFCALFAYFIYKQSFDPFISVVILLTLFYTFTFTGLRQTMAVSVIFLSYKFISEKKPIWFFVTVGIASLFHSSAMIFLPAYLIAKLKVGWKNVIAVAVSLGISLFAPGFFRSLVENLSWNESLQLYADSDATLTWSGYIIQLFIFIFCFVFRNYIDKTNEQAVGILDNFINLITVGLCFQSFAVVIAEMFRMSYYYSICSTIAIPVLLYLQKDKKNNRILYFPVLISFIAYMLFIQAYFEYTYFWS